MVEHALLAQALRNLGASAPQADAMAGQLLKRAAQLAAERGTTPERELEYLLRGVARARQGGLSAEYEQRHPPQSPPPPPAVPPG